MNLTMHQPSFLCIQAAQDLDVRVWAHGWPMGWELKMKTCQLLLYCLADRSMSVQERVSGAVDFCQLYIRGVQCHSVGDPVSAIANPPGMSSDLRKRSIDAINQINRREYEEAGDPEILSRISQYELAFRMQTSVPETMNMDDEPAYIHEMYGTEPGKKSFANNCLLARKLVEKGVRFVQLFDRRWDHHGTGKGNGVNDGLKRACEATDRPVAALLADLRQRGLLEDTLVIWGGEFGRTPMMETRGLH